ncbi:histidine phosphatase family protein [Litoreibacter arenae]|uniref:Phosphoglycerate mutase family 4 n=1 Tax=Litoreibacter arenae DSM 19593 TaxID=1123360 RepID=S9RYV9_9RHOB|nr:histidine phosphatase family protein [Litoreibacter arenae]EPX79139.1 Phosphoglycerate mutase family 4 [Litoreibacter arenae DSM 19593]
MLARFPDLYVLRHGETEWNVEGRMQGRLHSPLTTKGIAQAQAQRRVLDGVDLDGVDIISSPQTRAVHTAVEIFAARAAMIRTDAALCEIDAGAWQGRLRRDLEIKGDLKMTVDGPLALYEQAEGGEGFVALRQRCETFLATLSGPAILITHGITSRMLRTVALGLPTEAMADLPGGQGVVFHLKDGDQTQLE